MERKLGTKLAIAAICILVFVVIFSDENEDNRIFAIIAAVILLILYISNIIATNKNTKNFIKQFKKKLKKQAYRKQLIVMATSITAIIVLIVVVISSINISEYEDYKRAKEFNPSPKIESLANSLNLTDRAKNILYASSPQLKDKQAFNGYCGNDGDPNAYIAGCYYKKNDNEYIDIYDAGSDASDLQNAYYNYDNSKMVTLAHEMLHAVHARLSEKDLEWINKELDIIYSSNKELQNELRMYPDSKRYDELYTRSATEVYNLPSSLEKHYSVYFKDRQLIVKKYHDNKKQIDDMLAKADEIMVKIQNQGRIVDSAKTYWQHKQALDEYNRLVEVYNKYIDVYRQTLNKRDSEK